MRYLLLDRITLLDVPNRAVGLKCVSLSDDVFADHFPTFPVLPGALILESLAQLAGVLLEATARERGHPDLYAVLARTGSATFTRSVRPGDRLELEATTIAASGAGGRLATTARVDGELVVRVELTFALTAVTNARLLAHRRELLDTWLSRGSP